MFGGFFLFNHFTDCLTGKALLAKSGQSVFIFRRGLHFCLA